MNFCSFIFLFTVTLRVILATKKNIHKKDLYKDNNKNSSRVKCATKEPVYHELSQNDILYENFVKYDKEKKKKKNVDEGINDKKYSRNILNNKNSENIFESVKRGESCDYENIMVNECNVIPSSKSLLKKPSRMTRFKNKLYKMIFKRNKFWRVISKIITVLGDSAIICEIIMVIGYILKCCMCLCSCACAAAGSCVCEAAGSCVCATACTIITASGGAFGAIILLIILIIAIVFLLVTWLWFHKDVYYETHEQ
ncbi:hypothetical protein PFTANZ_00980 [Plasmodium falciparum Tanzania (2000708)]|uniref:Surface antigen n=1 Tax=Plasmodium falciparum Tanzania (2000708) TaxID=1036725 RepID=A0A024WC83_PLAFA|nr:hypothetical protein PFTANZ_00980 [Plasmodium falciparum Tanzania (2000708)]